MAAQNQIVTLSGKKYQLVPITKGTKAPAGIESVTWHDGNDYFLIPVVPTPKATDAPKAEAKAEAKIETNTSAKADVKPGTPWWVWAILALGVILLAVLLLKGSQTATTATPASTPAPVSSQSGTVSEQTVLNFGDVGTYHAVYDTNQNRWTIGIWPEARTDNGSNDLAYLKIHGGTISFKMPADGMVNNSAGIVTVDGQNWTLGNPIKNDGNSLILKDQEVKITYGANNDSAGCQIWFK